MFNLNLGFMLHVGAVKGMYTFYRDNITVIPNARRFFHLHNIYQDSE